MLDCQVLPRAMGEVIICHFLKDSIYPVETIMLKYWPVIKGASLQWSEDKAPRLGAALAYYTIFSIAPLLVITIGIAGLVFGQEAARSQISQQVNHLVGQQGGDAIEAMVTSANKPGRGTVGTVLGVAMLLFGAAGLFAQLQDALNTVWEVKPKPGRGIWGMLRDRFLSLSMVLGVAFLLLVSLIVSAALLAVGGLLGDWQTGVVGQLITSIVDVVISVLFASIFRYLPDAIVAWQDVWFGAIVASVFFTLGKFLIGLYLGQAGVGSGFGAAGSLAVLLVWLYLRLRFFSSGPS